MAEDGRGPGPDDEGTLWVDEETLRFRAAPGSVLDCLFDDQRVWSIAVDEHPPGDDGVRSVPWPGPIRDRLDGKARVELRDHASGAWVAGLDAAFGSSENRVSMMDRDGRLLAITKWGRLNQTFATTDRAAIEGYLDQVEAVLATLREDCGVPAFLSFGSLLGAVREGKLIGHDVDVDLGYYSAHDHPADVMRESFRIERVLRAKGWRVVRENGGFLALFFPQTDGTSRNLDVFTAFCTEGRLYQVHDVGVDADESAVLPLATTEFEGRAMPVPARPEVFLEAAYGADWRTPNPAFRFSTPKENKRRIAGWFSGLRGRRDFWRQFHGQHRGQLPLEPSAFSTWVAEREEPGPLIDVTLITGRDAWGLASEGFDVTCVSLMPRLVRRLHAPHAGATDPDVIACNLDSLREALSTGALLARIPGRKVVYGRFVLHELTEEGRANFWHLTAMALRSGGRCYLEFRTERDRQLPKHFGPHFRRFLDPDQVVAEAAAHGGRTIHREVGRALAPFREENPHVCRLVLEWSR